MVKIKINDKIETSKKKDKIVILNSKKEKISLKERFKSYNKENLTKDFTWDEPKGKEIW